MIEIKRQVNIEELQRKKILLKLFFIHDLHEYYDMEDISNKTTYWTIIKAYSTEGPKLTYYSILSIKNYYGEKEGFW
jgi:hypothetical protein